MSIFESLSDLFQTRKTYSYFSEIPTKQLRVAILSTIQNALLACTDNDHIKHHISLSLIDSMIADTGVTVNGLLKQNLKNIILKVPKDLLQPNLDHMNTVADQWNLKSDSLHLQFTEIYEAREIRTVNGEKCLKPIYNIKFNLYHEHL